MKILLIHSDFIEFEARQKAIKQAEEWQKGQKTRVEECLVVFTAVEKRDEGNVAQTAKNMVDEVEKVAKEVKASKIVFYPYAHLSKDLSSPATALEALRKAEEIAKERGLESSHAPFGWYKAFEIKAKGHPLSELSREITAEGAAASATKKKGGAQPMQAADAKELSEDDHRALGKKLDLYSFHDVAPGMAFFHPKGMIIRNELMSFWRSEHAKRGYSEINTPLIMNKSLWQMSGHWDHYKENMFFTTIDDVEFAVKPMNCPGAITVFNSSTRSYRDLPMKLAEPGQLEREIMNIVDIIEYFYGIFSFQYHVELSTRPDNSIGTKEIWDRAEKALEDALKAKKMNYKINPKDGAFYGPKIDFHIRDSLGRTWQCATCQVDFMLPERFDAKYVGEDNKPHRPVIIHRVIYGAIERFIGILVEHYKGAFPLWLSPVQVRVLALTDNNNAAVEKAVNMLKEQGIRADTDTRPSTVEYRVREAELQKIPYIIVIGEKEEQAGTFAVRARGAGKVRFGVKPDAFLAGIKEEIGKKA